MRVITYDDPAAFLAAVEPFLLKDEARHNLPLGISRVLVNQPDIYTACHLWLIEDGGRVVGVALMTPPHQLVLAVPAVAGVHSVLIEAITRLRIDLPGVIGGLPETGEFAALYTAAVGSRIASRQEQGIHVLSRVEPVPSPSGSPRPAVPDDLELLLEWYRAFHVEAAPGEPWSEERTRRNLHRRIEGEGGSGVWLWDDRGAVSLSGFGSPTRNGIRIGPVYTPPESRGRGYATALVAAQSAQLLTRGHRFCFLYTDLANTTSNALYRRIGYRLTCTAAQIAFASPDRV